MTLLTASDATGGCVHVELADQTVCITVGDAVREVLPFTSPFEALTATYDLCEVILPAESSLLDQIAQAAYALDPNCL